MKSKLTNIFIENFKSYQDQQKVSISDLTLLIGANSSGKSTALQALLILLQTLESNNKDIDVLLSGKYITVGSFEEVINNPELEYFTLGIEVASGASQQEVSDNDNTIINWKFSKNEIMHGHSKLTEISIKLSENEIKLIHENDNDFSINVNDNKTTYTVSVNNLRNGKLKLVYDPRLNEIYKDFLNEAAIALLGKKHGVTLANDTVMAIDGRRSFLDYLFNNEKHELEYNDSIDYDIMDSAKKLLSLINQYAETQCSNYLDFTGFYFPIEFGELAISSYISDDNISKLNIVVNKYKEKIETYSSSNKRKITTALLPVNYLINRGRVPNYDKENTSDEVWLLALKIYQNAINSVLSKIYYLGPLRDKPQGLYNIGFESNPKYVGTTGAYFPSVLLSERKNRTYPMPHDDEDEMKLDEAVNEWALHMNVASNINVVENNSFGFSVEVGNIVNKKSDIMNVGVGTSQVIPVLITGLLSEENSILIFEQPELHLHPYSQSRLADFFVAQSKNNKQIIIESHSEYFLLRLRYHVMKKRITNDSISLNFFINRITGTEVNRSRLNANGHIEYPDDFYDQTQLLLDEMINAKFGDVNE